MIEKTSTFIEYAEHETIVDVEMLTNTSATFSFPRWKFSFSEPEKSINFVINFNLKVRENNEKNNECETKNIRSEEGKRKNISRRSNARLP